MQSGYKKAILDLARLGKQTILPDLDVEAVQLNTLLRLQGTPVFQAFFILDSLFKTRPVEGDVCEYGAA
jgi:hypothetical protein